MTLLTFEMVKTCTLVSMMTPLNHSREVRVCFYLPFFFERWKLRMIALMFRQTSKCK